MSEYALVDDTARVVLHPGTRRHVVAVYPWVDDRGAWVEIEDDVQFNPTVHTKTAPRLRVGDGRVFRTWRNIEGT